jgi:hypothetical protein
MSIAEAAWIERARTGSPDFLNDLRDGGVSWNQLWEFYQRNPVDAGPMLALMGFFHAVLSRRYEREGDVLDRDGRVYPELREWARFVVANEAPAWAKKVRDSLAGLLGLSLISPLYFELVFSVYLEAAMERYAEIGAVGATRLEADREASDLTPRGRLQVRLAGDARSVETPAGGRLPETLSLFLARHYPSWDEAYRLALGDLAGERFDEGGEG